MPRPDDHPHLLPWYAAGTLGDDDARDVERHLEGCRRCRDELAALRSLGATLRGRHGAAPRRRLAWVGVAASVMLLAVAGGVALRHLPGEGAPPVDGAAAPAHAGPAPSVVTLLPTLRGPERHVSLQGPGPWPVRVLLPSRAVDGSYRLVWGAGGAPEPASSGPAVATDGVIDAELSAPVDRGRRELIVTATAPDDPAEYVYPVSLVR